MATYILTYNNRPITTVPGEYHFISKTPTDWEPVTWNGLTSFNGNNVWTDGINTYYSEGSNQYVLDVSTHTWSPKTWNGLTSFYGQYIWYNMYSGRRIYSQGTTAQKYLTTSTSTWDDITWTGLDSGSKAQLYGTDIWLRKTSSGTVTYFSYKTSSNAGNFKLASSTSWNQNGVSSTALSGYRFWYPVNWNSSSDAKTYYSNGTEQKYSSSSRLLADMSWGNPYPSSGYKVWSTNRHTYYSDGSTQLVLSDDQTSWSNKSWTGLGSGTTIDGLYVWTDRSSYYYSYGTTQLRLVIP